ncbi:MAG: hypothetical protein JO331_10465 [Verrucomicrobia bacterium]|nr:hypothetical protein [Verrucomicrobiota bacterium]
MPIPSPQTIVAQVIQYLQVHPEKLGIEPIPIAPEVLQNLTLSDGRALPPSLQRWLSFDAMSLGLLSGRRLRSTWLSEAGGPAFDTLQRLLLPDQIYDLRPSGGDSMWFLYGGEPDEDGEYPVFVLDVDDQYLVELCAPNFAVWLASLYNVGGFDLALGGPNSVGFSSLAADADLAASLRKQSQLNFQGFRYCEVYGTAISADGERTKWCSDDDLILDLKTRGFDDQTIQLMLGRT